MTRSVGRPRQQGNKDLPEGLHPPAGGRGAWRMTHPITGKIRTLKTKVRKEAIRRYWAIRKHYEKPVEIIAAEFAGGERTSELIEKYRTHHLKNAKFKGKPLSDNTIRTYDNYLENFRIADDLNVPVKCFDHVDEGPRKIRKYLAPWIDKPKTYNYRLSCLTRFFDWLIDTGQLVRNPCGPIEHRTPVASTVGYMPDNDFISITDRLAERYHQAYAYACDWLYLISGHPANMLDVKESQILEKEIHYTKTKNDQPVIVERDSEIDSVIEWFRKYKKDNSIASPYLIVHPVERNDWIELNEAGKAIDKTLARKPIRRQHLYRLFKNAARDRNLHHYTLRHIRPKASTDETQITGELSNKGAWESEAMMKRYNKKKLPIRVKNNLKRLKAS